MRKISKAVLWIAVTFYCSTLPQIFLSVPSAWRSSLAVEQPVFAQTSQTPSSPASPSTVSIDTTNLNNAYQTFAVTINNYFNALEQALTPSQNADLALPDYTALDRDFSKLKEQSQELRSQLSKINDPEQEQVLAFILNNIDSNLKEVEDTFLSPMRSDVLNNEKLGQIQDRLKVPGLPPEQRGRYDQGTVTAIKDFSTRNSLALSKRINQLQDQTQKNSAPKKLPPRNPWDVPFDFISPNLQGLLIVIVAPIILLSFIFILIFLWQKSKSGKSKVPHEQIRKEVQSLKDSIKQINEKLSNLNNDKNKEKITLRIDKLQKETQAHAIRFEGLYELVHHPEYGNNALGDRLQEVLPSLQPVSTKPDAPLLSPPIATLDPIAEAYNNDPTFGSSSPEDVVTETTANLGALRTGKSNTPILQRDSDGVYWVIRDQPRQRYCLVPRKSARLNTHNMDNLEKLYDYTPGFSPKSTDEIQLQEPAIVSPATDGAWKLEQKGKLSN